MLKTAFPDFKKRTITAILADDSGSHEEAKIDERRTREGRESRRMKERGILTKWQRRIELVRKNGK